MVPQAVPVYVLWLKARSAVVEAEAAGATVEMAMVGMV